MATLRGAFELVRLASFRQLLLAQGVSAMGDWMTNVALILLLFRLLNHPAAAGIVLVAKLLPRVLVYPFGGVLADKVNRRSLMIGADLGRAALALSLLLVQTPEQLWWALTATALAQVLASAFNPAAQASVPSLVPAERLGAANSLLSAVNEIAFFIGPLLGALAIAAGDVAFVFVLDAATFVCSALLLAGLRGIALPAASRGCTDVGHDLRLGWATVRRHRSLPLLFSAQFLLGTIITALNVLLVPLLVTHWQAPEALLGLLYGAVGIGCLLGALLAARITGVDYIRATLATLALIGAGTIVLGLVPWLGLGLVVLAVIGLATMVGEVISQTAIQSSVGDDHLGRVFGLLFWALALGQALGAVLGWVAGTLPPATLVIVLGLATVVVTAFLLTRTQRAARPVPVMTTSALPQA